MRCFIVRILHPNPNADYDMMVSASCANNAVWVAVERLRRAGNRMASIGAVWEG